MTNETSSPRLIVPSLGGFYDGVRDLSYPLIRASLGLWLAPHGAQKLLGWFGGGGVSGTIQFFETNLALFPGWFWAVSAGLIELVGGLCLLFGFLTRPVALLVVIEMLIAAFYVHLPNGFFWTGGGYEYPLMLTVIALAILFRGGGRLSVDSALGQEF